VSAAAVALFLPCGGGVEPLLADECRRLLADAEVVAGRGGVTVRGGAVAAMRLNLESRLAQRVLWPLADAPYRDEHDLYAIARTVRWSEWITPEQTLRVDTSARSSPLHSLHFAALRIKDAVCDALRETTGRRPSVDTRRPDLPLVLHLGADRATLYVDTSGEALFKRGWRDAAAAGREVKGEAPLKETLAAAMLAAADWRGRVGDGPLLDPCCGAGTIAIEAAQIACDLAPGLQRRFAFEVLAPFRDHRESWRALQHAARERVRPAAVPVFAGDVSFRMTDFARRNAERAGVGAAIAFRAGDALQRLPPASRGVMMLNPPYGERLAPKGTGAAAREGFGGAGGADEFFRALAAHWKRHYGGWTAWVLSPEMRLPGLMRLKESRRVPLWNGPIECRLFRFDLVSGPARPGPG
jgi:putative N6-adenine-specific DNA methylase